MVSGSLKFPGLAAYGSSKGTVITLIRLLAEYKRKKHFIVMLLALGFKQKC
jgi:hypothetical protein